MHPQWWEGSALVVQIPEYSDHKNGVGFGVTPALLSTAGVLLTLSHLENIYCDRYNQGNLCWENQLMKYWLVKWFWSEYTLYKIVIDYYRLTSLLHIEDSLTSYDMSGNNVWWEQDLPWKLSNAPEPPDEIHQKPHLFSVVQSSSGALLSDIISELNDKCDYWSI